jgi:hypothetical protein
MHTPQWCIGANRERERANPQASHVLFGFATFLLLHCIEQSNSKQASAQQAAKHTHTHYTVHGATVSNQTKEYHCC